MRYQSKLIVSVSVVNQVQSCVAEYASHGMHNGNIREEIKRQFAIYNQTDVNRAINEAFAELEKENK